MIVYRFLTTLLNDIQCINLSENQAISLTIRHLYEVSKADVHIHQSVPVRFYLKDKAYETVLDLELCFDS